MVLLPLRHDRTGQREIDTGCSRPPGHDGCALLSPPPGGPPPCACTTRSVPIRGRSGYSSWRRAWSCPPRSTVSVGSSRPFSKRNIRSARGLGPNESYTRMVGDLREEAIAARIRRDQGGGYTPCRFRVGLFDHAVEEGEPWPTTWMASSCPFPRGTSLLATEGRRASRTPSGRIPPCVSDLPSSPSAASRPDRRS